MLRNLNKLLSFDFAHRPYDTLEEVLGLRGIPGVGSLLDWGVTYRENALREDGRVDLQSLQALIESPGSHSSSIDASHISHSAMHLSNSDA